MTQLCVPIFTVFKLIMNNNNELVICFFLFLDGAKQKRSDVDGREESTHENGDSFAGC